MKSESQVPLQAQEIVVPGFESRRIAVQTSSAFGKAILWVDGEIAAPASKKDRYLVRRDDGREVEAYFKGAFPDPAPLLVIGDQTIRFAPNLKWYEWIWAAFPLLLIFFGGALGGALGAVAVTFNVTLFRSNRLPIVKYARSFLNALSAILLWMIVVSFLRGN